MKTKEKITAGISFLKIAFIAILGLGLLIPLVMITELVHERSRRKQSVAMEITSKWGQQQQLAGPVLVVPYEKEILSKVSEGGQVKTLVAYETAYLHLLPNTLKITQEIQPETRRRGIYRTVVYRSTTDLTGDFSALDLSKEGIRAEAIAWSKARLVIGVTDLKGLTAAPVVQWNSTHLESGSQPLGLFAENLASSLDLSGPQTTVGTFRIRLELRGSESMRLVPLGKENELVMKGAWGSPSFDGDYLPISHTLAKDSFEARWKVHSLDRRISQQWTGASMGIPAEGMAEKAETPLSLQAVVVAFPEGVDLYQQTERSLKYGLLIIVLAFLALMFTEILRQTPFHIIHYGLIGAALVIFYTLLLSFSEHIGYNAAYLAAFLATNAIVSWFVCSITRSSITAGIFAGILTLFFGFNFVLMQLEDYALLVGSIGLFVILAVLMSLTSRINWVKSGA